jgi:hypothetical protein
MVNFGIPGPSGARAGGVGRAAGACFCAGAEASAARASPLKAQTAVANAAKPPSRTTISNRGDFFMGVKVEWVSDPLSAIIVLKSLPRTNSFQSGTQV